MSWLDAAKIHVPSQMQVLSFSAPDLSVRLGLHLVTWEPVSVHCIITARNASCGPNNPKTHHASKWTNPSRPLRFEVPSFYGLKQPRMSWEAVSKNRSDWNSTAAEGRFLQHKWRQSLSLHVITRHIVQDPQFAILSRVDVGRSKAHVWYVA